MIEYFKPKKDIMYIVGVNAGMRCRMPDESRLF